LSHFCSDCGKKLEDGISCSCKKVNNGKNGKRVFSDIIIQFKEVILNSFSHPYDMMKKTANESYFLMTIFAIIVNGFCLSLVVAKIFSILSHMMLNFHFSSFAIQIPKLMLLITFLVVVFYMAYVGVVYIYTSRFCHKEISFKVITASMAVPAVVGSVFFFISFLLICLFGLFFLLGVSAGIILITFYRYQSVLFTTKVDHNKAGYLILSAQFLSMIAVFVVLSII